MEFINKLAPIVIPLLTAIAGLFTAWFKTRAAAPKPRRLRRAPTPGGYHAEAQRRHHRQQPAHAQPCTFKKGQESDDDTWGNIAIAFGGGLLIMGAFLISWPTISWTLVAYWGYLSRTHRLAGKAA